MSQYLNSIATFNQLLQRDAQAARFYRQCTEAQKKAIHQQLSSLHSTDNLEAFVNHLCSAAL